MSDVEDACGPTSVGRVGLRVGAIFVILVRRVVPACPTQVFVLSPRARLAPPLFPGDFCLWDHVPDPFEAGTVPEESHPRLAFRLCQVGARPEGALLLDLPLTLGSYSFDRTDSSEVESS